MIDPADIGHAVTATPGMSSFALAKTLGVTWHVLHPIMQVAELQGFVWGVQENPDAFTSAWLWYPPSSLGKDHMLKVEAALEVCERRVVQFFSKDTDIPCLAGDPQHRHFTTAKEYRNRMHSITVVGFCDRCALDTRHTVRI